jgi:hypothetical protein
MGAVHCRRIFSLTQSPALDSLEIHLVQLSDINARCIPLSPPRDPLSPDSEEYIVTIGDAGIGCWIYALYKSIA